MGNLRKDIVANIESELPSIFQDVYLFDLLIFYYCCNIERVIVRDHSFQDYLLGDGWRG